MRRDKIFGRFTLVHAYLSIGIVAVMTIGITLSVTSREVPGDQDRGSLIKFNHEFHVKDAGIACLDCHEAAGTSTRASDNLLSKKVNCQTCHEEQLSTDCTYCHTSDDVSTYVAFASPKRELIFSHAFHVTDRSMTCETCHTGIDASTAAGGSHLPPMASCNTCHNDVVATNICESCHTNFASLRPKEHDRTNFGREHKFLARMGDETCMTCHTQESCQDCHVEAGLQTAMTRDFDLLSPRSPRLTANDRAQGMVLTKVHDLNFRFTHGIAAAGKSAECQTCHSAREFCSTCHAAGGNVNQLQFRPASHQQPRFVTIGLGSGGGLHAQLARRDIETCASCHDAQGADPTCVTCHADPDGIKGTNPKTHPRGFMGSVQGDWHSDPGANCYVCHTDPNARVGGLKEMGFCSYCHQ
ncbi:MAG: cytochrome c3 family protein [Bacteroidota bacterium]